MIPGTIDRRAFLKKGAALLIVCTGAGLGPFLARNRKIFQKSVILMSTIAEIQIVHDDARQAHHMIDQALAEIRRIERLMSRFRDNSDIGRANKQAFKEPVPVSEETAEVIARASHWSRATDGAFDPAIGKLVEIWDIKNRTQPPQEKQFSHLANRFFYKNVHLTRDSGKPFLSFSTSEVQLDLGGIAKGYAVDRAIDVLTAAGIKQALVNLGGDVVALGGKNRNQGWKVGIRDPHNLRKIAKALDLQNQSVATSGNYEQYFIAESSLYHHLIDPALARPGRSKFHSLTVIGPNGCDTDALATGLFFFSEDKTKRLLEENTEGVSTIRLG